MNKNIVICLDGTWNDKDAPNTKSNVVLLSELCVNDELKQIVYYDKGVGTSGWYDKKLGGVHGVGLSKNIREAYSYLVKNYKENDKVFVFGFSRGAYTARSLAGLLYQCGLLVDDQATVVERLYDAYKSRNTDRMNAFKLSNRNCPIAMLGVWDTVGALGIPFSILGDLSKRLLGFHNTKLSPEVKLACHALAADEKRASFEPTLWQQTEENTNRMKQVWFAGVHSDVGGGYPERHHSDVALKWMVEQAVGAGLLIKEDAAYKYQEEKELINDIHESNFKIFGFEVGVEPRIAPLIAENRTMVHRSVLEKIRLTEGHYKPTALMKHLTDRLTLSPFEIED